MTEAANRRLATIVALDVAGYSARTEADEAKTTAEIAALRQVIEAIAARHGGRVFNTAGDGFMLEFGSSLSAVQASFELAETCEPKVRVGVHLGDVAVQPNGDLLGHGVNVAARLMAQSTPGSSLVSIAVRQTLRGPVLERLISRGVLRLDKMNESIEAFAMVTAAKVAPVVAESAPIAVRDDRSADPPEAPDRLPHVGRTHELSRARELIAQAKRGEGSMLLFSGEAGVGKTRMTVEVQRLARAEGFLVLRGSNSDTESPPPYQPLLQQIEQAQRLFGRAVMRRTMGENAAELGKLMPELRQQYSDIPAHPVLPPEQERRYLLHGVAEFIARSAALQPLMLVFEDLHWADESTSILLRHLAERLKREPVMLVGTYRDAELSSAGPFGRTLQQITRERLAEDLRLTRLSQSELAEMLEKKFGLKPPAALVELVYSESEGNPFFIEEVIQLLQDSGKLLTAEGKFRDDIEIADTEVTRGVKLIIEDRVSRSSQLCRDILTFAAVAGRQFSFDLLVKAEGKHNEDEVLTAIEEAEAKRLIEDVSQGRIARYQFVHEQIRQTLLSGLSRPRRQRTHLRIADALEQMYPGALEKYAGEIGHHLYLAGSAADHARTAHHLRVAAERAIDALAFEDALRQLDLALVVLEEQGDAATRARLQGLRSKALHGAERVTESLAALELAVSLAPTIPEKDDYRLQRGRMLLDLWRGAEAIDDLERLQIRAHESGDAARELDVQSAVARAYYVMSLDRNGFAEKAKTAYERAIELARAQGAQQALAKALIATATFVDYWPEYKAQAFAHLDEAQRIAHATNDEEIELDVATQYLGFSMRGAPPVDDEAVFKRLIALRDPIRLNAFYFRMMWATHSSGRLERCVEICSAGIELAYRIGTLPVQYPTIRALALMDLGRFAESWQSLGEEIADDAHRFGAALRDMGKLYYELLVGDYEGAFNRAPHVIAESKALSRAWMLTVISGTLASAAPEFAGDEPAIARIDALSATAGVPLGRLGKAALAFARGNYALVRQELDGGSVSPVQEAPGFSGRSTLVPMQLLARVALLEGRGEDARTHLSHAVDLARKANMKGFLWQLLGDWAHAEEKLGNTADAARLHAEAQSVLSAVGQTVPDPQHRATLVGGRVARRLGLA